jgi:hypothetical protein
MVKCDKWTQATTPLGILIDSYWPNPTPTRPTMTPKTDPPGTPFPFLSLTRELRDLVYFHFLPHTLSYHRPTCKAISQWHLCAEKYWPPRPCEPHPYLPLFLSNRQLRNEAQEILFRATTISLPSGRRLSWSIKRFQVDERLPLHLTLSSFPSRQVTSVTRVSREYCGVTDSYFVGAETDEACGMWARVVSDSWIVKGAFPKLRRFEVKWQTFEKHITDRFWYLVAGLDPASGETERKRKVEEVAGVFVRWLKDAVQDRDLVPPVWLKIGFECNEQVLPADKYGLKVLEDGLAAAHRVIAKKTLSRVGRDESGRQWLEGLSETRKRGRKGWCDAVVAT